MADIVQIQGGPKARLPRLPDRGLGYCTDTKELYIGTTGANVLLVPAGASALPGALDQTNQALRALQGAVEALTKRVEALEKGGGGP